MELSGLLARCSALESRAAALYRQWAAASREDPGLCDLWTSLAREEEEHAQAIHSSYLGTAQETGWRTQIDGWEDAVREIDVRLADAERLGQTSSLDQQLAAALSLEMTEIDALRHLLLTVTGHHDPEPDPEAHAARLARAAEDRSADPHVRVLAALLLTRSRLRHAS